MQDLIASYLFHNNTCPLPGMGFLSIIHVPAIVNFSEKKIMAPQPFIQFTEEEINENSFLQYIAAITHHSISESQNILNTFCENLKNEIKLNTSAALQGIGNFYNDGSGKLQFRQEELPTAFLPSVIAERVIHPDAKHSILVGDKETTNIAMTDYFNQEPAKKHRWWIAAIVIVIAAIAVIILYLNDKNHSSFFGSLTTN